MEQKKKMGNLSGESRGEGDQYLLDANHVNLQHWFINQATRVPCGSNSWKMINAACSAVSCEPSMTTSAWSGRS